ncbi:DNA-directed DNA polymerase [Synchytrium endobioticum]|uniref:DNA-directed DNA polymerase n=1 Tax=Synchytrium endobioticum TaxID=286115 RepID=A0A507DCC9_9FUNG|nr:DNA-directed DNA polymerase [Synchytrium endobioticum]
MTDHVPPLMGPEKDRHRLASFLKQKCIIHIDLDAFYTQVEHVRLNISKEIPLAVQQWQGLIAINYPARAHGIKRHVTPKEAKDLCPDIQFVHVATYAAGETTARYHDHPSPLTHKVSLDVYRAASKKIFHIFKRFATQYAATLERASIDEAFLDVSDEVNRRILHRRCSTVDQRGPLVKWDRAGYLYGNQDPESRGWGDFQLAIAADISSEIRAAIATELTYSCSAGIAHNKTLAKLCSGLNKPNKQTVMRESETCDFMKTLPFDKIRGLGGKLGDLIGEHLQIEHAGDLWVYSEAQLTARYGETGVWLYNICRGICRGEVKERAEAKSMNACKALRPALQKEQDLRNWMSILASELYTRVHDEFDETSRWPKTFSLHHFVVAENVLMETGLALLSERRLPCSRLAIGAQSLVKEGTDNRNITSFFKALPVADLTAGVTADTTALDGDQENSCRQGPPTPTTLCDKCQKNIPIADTEEHRDYHFALELAQSERHLSKITPKSHHLKRSASSTGNGGSSNSYGGAKKRCKIISSETTNKIKNYFS